MLCFVTFPSIPDFTQFDVKYVLTNWHIAIPWFGRIIRHIFKWLNKESVLLEGFLWLLANVQVQKMYRAAFSSLRTCEHWENFLCNVQLFVCFTSVL